VTAATPGPRKQRTRQHLIADLSAHHVEGPILEEGHTALKVDRDYGYDLQLYTFDAVGYAEPSLAYLQLKAAEALTRSGDDFVFDVDVRDYNLWMLETVPVFLLLFDAGRRRAYGVYIQGYFAADASRRPRHRAKTVRVRVPARQRVTRAGVRQMCRRKRARHGPR